jgi:hypothetical protein
MLKLEFDELQDLGFDLELTGFSLDEIGNLNPPVVDGLTDEDAVPEAPEKPVTVLGDVWLLGAYYQCDSCGKEFSYEEGSKFNECPSC